MATTPDGRDRVLRGYGEVMVVVQQWELGLALLWWDVTRKTKSHPAGDFDTPRSQKEIRRLQAAFYDKTAGVVIDDVSGRLEAEEAKNLKPLWAERNRLAHRFLREQADDAEDFKQGTHDELVALGDRFIASMQDVKDALGRGEKYEGPVLPHWPALAGRLLGRLEQGERIPRDPSDQ